jgi:hypothetical protein
MSEGFESGFELDHFVSSTRRVDRHALRLPSTISAMS